jgi:hypothetical protein
VTFISTDKLRSEIKREVRRFVIEDDCLAEAIGEAISAIVEERCDELAARIAAFSFKGQWSEEVSYKAGNFCTFGGALFCANSDNTKSRPGIGSHWTLAAARGRDGRDYSPPPTDQSTEARTTKSARR